MSEYPNEVEPLIAKLMAINQALDDFHLLVKGQREEALALFKTTTLLTREQAAERLGLSLSQLDRESRKGALPEIWIDRRPRYSLADLEGYIAARRRARRKHGASDEAHEG